MEDAAPKTRIPKFRHTREIVRIALDDGMTQEAIAKLCRTQQSVVSAWAGGKARAREDVIRPLVNRYGHRLNRMSSRLYLVQGEPAPAWCDTPDGQLVHRLLNDTKAYVREHTTEDEWREFIAEAVERRVRPEYVTDEDGHPGVSDEAPRDDGGELTEEALLPVTEADLAVAEASRDYGRAPAVALAWSELCRKAGIKREGGGTWLARVMEEEFALGFHRLVRVDGAPIWRHVLGQPRRVARREGRHGERIEVVLEPVARWVVHPAGATTFRLIVQTVRRLTGLDAVAWAGSTRGGGIDTASDDGRVRSDDDVARWIGTIHGPFDLPTLLAEVEGRLPAAGPHDRAVVPFTLRKALVERGYDVPGVEFIPL